MKCLFCDRYRSSLHRQLAVDMLRQGYHNSFRELCDILVWQKEDRERLGTEHPLHRQPLLNEEPDKLRFLCIYLSKAEEAERKCMFLVFLRKLNILILGQYSNVYKSYLEIASFFSKSDDYWLSDLFYKKCLSVAQTYPQLDSELAARAYLNIGLSYERKGWINSRNKIYTNYSWKVVRN